MYVAVMLSRLLCKCFCQEEPPWNEYVIICNLHQEVWHICSLFLKRGGLCVDLQEHDVGSTSLQCRASISGTEGINLSLDIQRLLKTCY